MKSSEVRLSSITLAIAAADALLLLNSEPGCQDRFEAQTRGPPGLDPLTKVG